MARTKKYPGVYERNDTNGKSYYFVISTIDPKNGKRRQKKYGGYSNPGNAYKDLIDMKDKQNKGKYTEPSKMTLKEWIEKWISRKELTYRDVTFQSYKHRIEHIVEDYGNLQLNTLTVDIFTDLHRTLLNKKKIVFNGKKKVVTDQGLSSRTIHDILKVLKLALIQAYREDLIPKKITDSYKLPPEDSKDHDILMPHEVPILLNAAKGDPMYAAIYLAASTGLRESEILGLTWDGVDFDNGIIDVFSTLSRVKVKGNGKIKWKYVISNQTKTPTSKRKIEIDDEIIAVLKEQYQIVQGYKEDANDLYQDHNLVCPTSIGTPINPSNLRRSFYRITAKAGVTKVTFHELRHGFLSHLLFSGVDSKVAASIAGHSSTRITNDIYQHILKGVQLGALSKYRKLITPKK